jgi:hypothetical protein
VTEENTVKAGIATIHIQTGLLMQAAHIIPCNEIGGILSYETAFARLDDYVSRLSLYVSPKGQCVMHFSGFSWLAGLFPLVWALHRRLYGLAGLILVYTIANNGVMELLGMNFQIFLLVLQFVIFGLFANRFHRLLLERRGWLLTEEEPLRSGDPKS